MPGQRQPIQLQDHEHGYYELHRLSCHVDLGVQFSPGLEQRSKRGLQRIHEQVNVKAAVVSIETIPIQTNKYSDRGQYVQIRDRLLNAAYTNSSFPFLSLIRRITRVYH